MGVTERREREREEVRTKILDAARDLFTSEGYEKVTMRRIAEAIEYSPTAIYLHFEDKEDLVLALCRQDFGKLLAAGITALVCGQAAINLAAALGIAPLTGIPLPFVSYGGSSLVVLLASVGILLNIAVNGRVVGASVRDRGGRDRGARSTRSRSRRSASRTRSDGDVRRVARPRRVAARS